MNTPPEGPWGPSNGKRPEETPPKRENGPTHRSPKEQEPSPWGDIPPEWKKINKALKNGLGGFAPRTHTRAILIAVLVLVGIWLLSGFYMVGTDQLGVVMRFGALNRTEIPGLHYHLPAPIEDVLLPVVTAQNEIQIGFRKPARSDGQSRNMPRESQMLTQDENIINVEFTVFWRIHNVDDYLFQIRNPETTVKMAAESAMREVIGQSKLQFALTEGRAKIADEARARLQQLMDEYKAGVTITQINLQNVSVPEDVREAFQDVINARLDMERFQNQAAAHVNKVIPDAKGQAAQLIQKSKGYRDQKIAIAKGDAERFKEVFAAYNGSRDVTTKRLYLETMENILGNAPKIITDGKNAGAIPLYPLTEMTRRKPALSVGGGAP